MALTARYLAGMFTSVVVIGSSAALPTDLRVMVWAIFLIGWVVGALVLELTRTDDLAMRVAESTIERFGLFTIIVLGEVVVGAVTGLSEVEHNLRTTATGVIGLMIGFGIWWTYFDFVGRRAPRSARASMLWMVCHLPVTLSVAASGAALVTLIEHAADERAPANAAWVLAGSVAVALVGLIATMWTLADYQRLISIYRPLSATMGIGAIVVMLVGWWRPAPWLLALGLVGVLSVVWIVAVDRWLRLPNPSDARPGS
jgi:low temperature requirement protein LtrA